MKKKTKTTSQRIEEETNFLGNKKIRDLLSSAFENLGYNPNSDVSIPDFFTQVSAIVEEANRERFEKSDTSIKQRFENIPEALEEYSVVIKYYLDKFELLRQAIDRLKDHLEFKESKLSRDGQTISDSKRKQWGPLKKELRESLLIKMRNGASFGTALNSIEAEGKLNSSTALQSLMNTIPEWCQLRKKAGEKDSRFKNTEQYKFAIEFDQLMIKNYRKRKASSVK